MVTHHPLQWMSAGSRGNTSASMSQDSSSILALKTLNICCCMCVDTIDACLFSTGRSKIALGSVHPCASLCRAHSSDQAGCQTNRWSQQQEMLPRVFWDVTATVANADTNTWHCVTADCCRRRRGAHMITRQIMFVSGDSNVTALERQNRGGWFNGAVMLQPSDHCHMLWGGGHSQFLSLTMCVIQSLRWTTAIMDHKVKTPLLKCNFYPWFSLYWLHFSHIPPHCHPDRQCESTACWLTEFLALSSRGWSKGVSVSR